MRIADYIITICLLLKQFIVYNQNCKKQLSKCLKQFLNFWVYICFCGSGKKKIYFAVKYALNVMTIN